MPEIQQVIEDKIEEIKTSAIEPPGFIKRSISKRNEKAKAGVKGMDKIKDL